MNRSFVNYGWRVATVLSALVLGAAQGHAGPDKPVIGRVERVAIYPGNLVIRARIDTGAKTASLNCRNMERFTRDGREWVRCPITNTKGKTIVVEHRVVRMVGIKRHDRNAQQRPVIRLGVCLAGHYRTAEVNLTDRTGFNYQMLIGRNFLEGFLVDPTRSFLGSPRCADAPGRQ